MPKYTLVKKLGHGAFGTVSLIETPSREKFAVKSVKTSDIGEEAKIMSRLHHPNIVFCFHSFRQGFNTYLIMEFCDGGTLTSFIHGQARPINEPTVLRMLWEIAAALQYLHHEKKIYHRDLKPDNILLTGPEKTVKVGDIGLGRMVDYSHQGRGPYQIGTPIYMSPEIINFEKHTEKTDIWSFGCCVHEIMTQAYTITNPQDLSRPVVPIPRLPHHYSAALKNLVLKGMLQKNPERRSSAWEIREAAEVRKLISFTKEQRKTNSF